MNGISGPPEEIAVPDEPRSDRALDVAAVLASMVPWLGGPIGSVLSGVVTERRRQRIVEVLQELNAALRGLESHVARQYVQTEDFEDLLAETLERVARERSEAKRQVYKRFLVDAIRTPGGYDEQLDVLRILEQLQPDHLRILAVANQPPKEVGGISGSIEQALRRRLPSLAPDLLERLVMQLDDLRITQLHGSYRVMMTSSGAEDLRSRLTRFGQRLTSYLSPEAPGR
jgi:hypothetical protein